MFFTTDLNEGWDGTFNNKQQEFGIYIYFVAGKANGFTQPIEVKGNLTLLR